MDEVWKDSFTYPEYFSVSSFGRIKRKPYQYLKLNYSKLGKEFLHNTVVKEIILKPTVNRTGYLIVKTSIEGKIISFSIHKEVAYTFLGQPPSDGYVVDHLDKNRANNFVVNLRWVSREGNTQNTEYTRLRGKASARFSGKVEAYSLKTGELVAELYGNLDMKIKGFDYRLVSAVLKGKRNSHNGCYFVKTAEGVTVLETQIEAFSKTTFKPIDFLDEHGNIVFTVQQYDELLEKGFIPLNVSNVLTGKAKTHKGYFIKLHNEGEI